MTPQPMASVARFKARRAAAEVVAAGILPRSVKASSVINFVRSLRRRI
jgi:hypothetical protein